MSYKVFLVGNTDILPTLATTLLALNYTLAGNADNLIGLADNLEQSGADSLVASMTHLEPDDRHTLVNMQTRTPVTMVIHLEQADSTTPQLAGAGVGSLVIGGLQPPQLPLLLDIAGARQRQLMQMREQITTLKNTLQERKLVDRAKGLIMGKGKYSEEQAYHALRKLAMNQNRTMADVAEGVISSADLFN